MSGALNRKEWLAACGDLAKTYEQAWEEADRQMTDIEQKALALLNEVLAERHECLHEMLERDWSCWTGALCRAIEQHEAFKQEVSREMEGYSKWCKSVGWPMSALLERFIIPKPKPDPLVEVLKDFGGFMPDAEDFRTALEARGLEIRSKSDD